MAATARSRVTRSGGGQNVTLPNLPADTPLTGAGGSLWAAAILTMLNAPTNRTNVSYMLGWFHQEGGGGQNNPMNTKLQTSDSVGQLGGAAAGVQDYGTPAGGVRATAQTLLTNFPNIVTSLRAGEGIPNTPANATELHSWSAGPNAAWSAGYSTITPLPAFAQKAITVGPGPNGGIVRPGGSGASSATGYPSSSGDSGGTGDTTPDYTSLETTSRTAPVGTSTTEDVGLIGSIGGFLGINGASPFNLHVNTAPFTWWWQQVSGGWNEFNSGVHDVQNTVNGVVDAGHAVDSAAAEGYVILKNLPWYFLRAVEFMSGFALMGIGLYLAMRPTGGAPSGPGRAIRYVTALSPVGRGLEARKYTRMGRREGRQEHYRLQGRREQRSAMSAQQAARTQRAGQSRRG